MFNALNDAAKQWNKANDRHAKLQHVYIIAAVVIVIFAGLVNLLNAEIGQYLLSISFGLFVIFLVNAVAWALADSFVISRLASRSSRK